ncbi:MAG TPA: ribonuclease Y [Campylobacterales bacterium]|nr:ribonuclease Y [Campylobacterales bacterium]
MLIEISTGVIVSGILFLIFTHYLAHFVTKKVIENYAKLLLKETETKLAEMENERIKELTAKKRELQQEKLEVEKLKSQYQKRLKEVEEILENSADLSKEEARKIILQQVEEEEEQRMQHIIKKYEKEAKEKGQEIANNLIAQATTRYAGEFASEQLYNIIKLKSDDLKSFIIGRKRRNIKHLETVLGVDIIVDKTPKIITISSFNLYRRAIAVKTIEKLIEDGRIQPARIEEIHEKVVNEFDKEIIKEAENVVLELGIGKVHPELLKLIGKLRYRASYGQNALIHSKEVAYLAGMITAELGGDEVLARRAGLLHDIGKALTHESGGNHVDLGVEVCKKYGESDIVINAIYAHHEYEEPKTIEVAAVCTADKLSAGRPGARRKTYEQTLKRIQEIENIALSYEEVKSSYAVNSGRELRVIVDSNLASDEDIFLLSKEIARKIEKEVKRFPGEIVVNVIREKRAESVARSV